MTILMEMLIALYTIKSPGSIITLPYELGASGYDRLMEERRDILLMIDRNLK